MSLANRLVPAILTLALAAAAQAQTPPAGPNPLRTRPGWMVGAQVSNYAYHEPSVTGGGPDFAKLTGTMGGLLGSYTWTSTKRVWSTVDLREAYGRLKYEGSGTQNNVPNTIVEVRGVAGMDFLAGSNTVFSPYVGLGYRYLYDDNRGYSSSNSIGYRRYSNYLYAPVGLTTRIGMGEKWVFAPTLEYDYFIQGRQASKLSDTDTGVSDVTNSQDKGYGYRGYLMFEREHWAFGGWMHYWHVNDSDIQCITPVVAGSCLAAQEPKNWTREYGAELRYRF